MFKSFEANLQILLLVVSFVLIDGITDWKIEHNQFDLTNRHRKEAPTLRFTLNGVNVTKVDSSEASTHIELSNKDHPSSHIEIKQIVHLDYPNVSEYEFVWTNAGPSLDREVCFHYGFNSASWYSTYEEKSQYWPMNTAMTETRGLAFVTTDFYTGHFGDIIEHLFVNSDGFGLMLHDVHPWFVRRDPNHGTPLLCVSVSNQAGPYPRSLSKYEPGYFDIRFNIRTSNNIKTLYQTYSDPKFDSKYKLLTPKSIPDERVFRYPIWSTWAEYKKNINESNVMDYATKMVKHGFPNSQLEIDEQWDPHFGDFKFDTHKFPDAKKMIADLKKMGFRVTAWAHPFVNQDSVEFTNENKKYFIKDHHGNTLLAKWWESQGAAATDFSNPEAGRWYVERLMKLRNETGLDSFKFDAGELNFYGMEYVVHDPLVQQLPSLMTNRYAETVAQFGPMVEVRSAYKSQHLPIFVRMLDKYSDWSIVNGLKTLVTTSLMMSLAGYHFNLPDMIGGNAYGPKPDSELYIRWIQANAFLPALQFSIPPWDYDEKTMNITKKYVDLHAAHADTIIKLAKRTVHGEPIIRPMWFAEPEDVRAFKIADQFMLGEDIVVAPVLEKGHHERHVYLPSGTWIDSHGKSHNGSAEIKVQAPIEELPYFVRKI